MLCSIVVPQYKRAAQHLAEMVFVGATLTTEELKNMINHLLDLLNDEHKKIPFKEENNDPLTLKDKLPSNFFGYDFSRAKNMTDVFETIHKLIDTTAKFNDKKMQYLIKSLKNMLKPNLKNIGFEVAKNKVLSILRSLFHLVDEMPEDIELKKTVSPQELKEMQDSGVIPKR
jgi:hypothetical protein